MVKCQECGSENPNEAIYCEQCGKKLSDLKESKPIKPKKDITESYQEKKLDYDDKSLKGEYDVCHVCGTKISDGKLCFKCEKVSIESYNQLKTNSQINEKDFPTMESFMSHFTKDPMSKKKIEKYSKKYSKDLLDDENIYYAGNFGGYTIQKNKYSSPKAKNLFSQSFLIITDQRILFFKYTVFGKNKFKFSIPLDRIDRFIIGTRISGILSEVRFIIIIGPYPIYLKEENNVTFSRRKVGTALRMTGVETILLPSQRSFEKEFEEQFRKGLIPNDETIQYFATKDNYDLILTDKKFIKKKYEHKLYFISYYFYNDIIDIEENRNITGSKSSVNIKFKSNKWRSLASLEPKDASEIISIAKKFMGNNKKI